MVLEQRSRSVPNRPDAYLLWAPFVYVPREATVQSVKCYCFGSSGKARGIVDCDS